MADGTLNFDTKVDSSGFSGAVGQLGGIAGKAFAGVTAAVGAGTVAFAALTKSALDNVASYEQLVGGVETLFGAGGATIEEYAASVGKSVSEVEGQFSTLEKAQTTVLDNANNAYRTAGMSANQYMETVTSFAAALKQSTSDEVEAANVADQAIRDMSDNANKMGTSMESIQNAYQGFAKQNYTMLDNLKLGYGGTKSEMERLLADAEKIHQQTTGEITHYDINNLSDVYNAIHEVQTELGITGTTAKEASTTIEGSMNAAKAAWDNFLTGTGDVDQLAESVATLANNVVTNLSEIIPRLASGLPALVSKLGDMIPGLFNQILPALINGAVILINGLVTVLPELIQGLVPPLIAGAVSVIGALVSVLPSLLSTLGSIGLDLMNTIAEGANSFDYAGFAESIVKGISGFISGGGFEQFAESAVNILKGLSQGISTALPVLIPEIVKLVIYIGKTIIQQIPMLIQCAGKLLVGLAQGIAKSLPVIAAEIPNIITAIITALVEGIPMIISCAGDILIALADGLLTAIPALIAAIPSIIMAIFNGLVTGIPKIITAIIQLIQAIIQKLGELASGLFAWAATTMGAWIQSIGEWFAQIPGTIWTHLISVLTTLGEWGDSVIDWITTNVPAWIESVGEWFAQLPESIAYALGFAIGSIIKWGADVVKWISTNVPTWIENITTFFSELPGKIWTWLVNTVTKIVEWGVNMKDNASTAIQSMIDAVINFMKQLPGKVWTWLVDTANKLNQWRQDLVTKGTEAATGLFNAVVDGVKGLPDKMLSIGEDIVTGIWNGISSGWSWLTDQVSSLAESLLEGAKDALGIASPSKAFRDEFGRWILPGAEIGIEKTMPSALKTMRTSARALLEEMKGTVSDYSGEIALSAGASESRRAFSAGGTSVYYDNRIEQTNNYHEAVPAPSVVAKNQREAIRNIVGGVK